MVTGRAMLLPRMLRDAQALREQLPAGVPSALRSKLSWMAAQGVRHLMRKYGVLDRDTDDHEAQARHALSKLRVTLVGGRKHVLGRGLTFADITLASALQFILPVADRYIALGPATRRAWTHTGLATDHGDLIAWRDRLYEQHRAG